MGGVFSILMLLVFAQIFFPNFLISQDFSGEICFNQLDDDQDGWVDCNDLDCQGDPNCSEDDFFTSSEICSNRIDDNRNGLIDCQDPACANDFSCQNASVPPLPSSEENFSSESTLPSDSEIPSVLIYIPGKPTK